MRAALEAEGLADDAFAPFFQALWRPRLLDLRQLPASLGPLVKRHLSQHRGQWLAATVVYPRPGAASVEAIRRPLEQITARGARVSVTGAPLAGPQMARLLRQDLTWMAPLTLAVVALLVTLLLRRLWPVLATLASLCLGAALFCGGLRLLGLEVDLYNLMVLPVIIGYGVDDHIYVVRRAQDEGLRAALVHSGRAVVTTTLTTLAAFGALALCTLPGLRGLGLTAVLGVSLGLLTSLVVLPALLSLGGRLRVKS